MLSGCGPSLWSEELRDTSLYAPPAMPSTPKEAKKMQEAPVALLGHMVRAGQTNEDLQKIVPKCNPTAFPRISMIHEDTVRIYYSQDVEPLGMTYTTIIVMKNDSIVFVQFFPVKLENKEYQ